MLRNTSDSWPIKVPTGDAEFDPYGMGNVTLPFSRSARTERNTLTNQYTSFIDLSGLYGNNQDRANAMRLFSSGLLNSTVYPSGEFPIRTSTELGPNKPIFLYGSFIVNLFPVCLLLT